MNLTELLDYKNPLFQKIVGGIVLSLLITVFWYLGYYSKNVAVISDKRAEYEGLQKKLKSVKMKATSLKQLKKEAGEIFIKYKILESLLPSERNVPAFLDKIYSSAQEHNLLIKNISPQKTKKSGFYNEDPYSFTMEGSYHDFGEFLSKVLNLPIIVIPDEIQFSGTDEGMLNLSLKLTTYHIASSERLEPPRELSSLVDQTASNASNKADQDSK